MTQLAAIVPAGQQQQQNQQQQPKESEKLLFMPPDQFLGKKPKEACTHWALFEKYEKYQRAVRFVTTDAQFFTMFRLTLSKVAVTWFDATLPSLTTFDSLKKAFLKRFNEWGLTKRELNEAWTNMSLEN